MIDVDVAKDRRRVGDGPRLGARVGMVMRTAVCTFLMVILLATTSSTTPPRPRVLLMRMPLSVPSQVQSVKRTWRHTAGGFASDDDQSVCVRDGAAGDGDIFGRAIDAQAVGVAAGFEAKGVVADVGETVGDHDMPAGIDVAGVGVGRFGRINEAGAMHIDVIAEEEMERPKRRVREGYPVDADVGAIADLAQRRAPLVGVGGIVRIGRRSRR